MLSKTCKVGNREITLDWENCYQALILQTILNLNVRPTVAYQDATCRALAAAGVCDVRDLIEFTEPELLTIRGIGPVAAAELKRWVEFYGLHFASEAAEKTFAWRLENKRYLASLKPGPEKLCPKCSTLILKHVAQ